MTSIGETIRRERLKKGLEIPRIADDIKISARLLEAIEAEQFDKLPGGVFSRSFVRQYARAVGLEEDDIRLELDRALPIAEAAPVEEIVATRERAHGPGPDDWKNFGARFQTGNGSLSRFALLVVVLAVCGGIYTLWQRTAREEPASTAAALPAVDPPVARPASEQTEASRAETQPAAADPPAAGGDAAAPAGTSQSVATSESTASAQPTPEPAPPTEPGPGLVRVELTAAEPVWVSASSQGKTIFSGVIPANGRKTLETPERARLLVGNAGALEVMVNGKPVGEIGPKGQVRVVQIAPEGVQVQERKPAAPANPPLRDIL